MLLPTVEANKLVDSAKFSWIDVIYRDSIPLEVVDSTDQTVLLITEWLNEPADYANSDFKGWTIGVEAQLFYSLNLPADFQMMDSEIAFAELFQRDGWNIEQSKEHIEDPDTHQYSRVFYFSKNLMIKKGVKK